MRLWFLSFAFLLLAACQPVDRLPVSAVSATPDPLQPFVDASRSQATAVAAAATAQYFGVQLTATVEARSASATSEALSLQASATQRAWAATATADSNQSTAVARSTATQQAQSAAATQQALDITATAGAINSSAYATAMHGQSESVRLAVEREEITNQARAILPITFSAITVLVVLVLLWRYLRVRPIQRDSRGDAPLLIIDGAIYDADRNPLPVMQMHKGQPQIPMLTPPELQAPTTARDQAIDLARSLPAGKAQSQIQRTMLPSTQPTFQVIQPDQLPPLLGGDTQMSQILDAEWSQDEPTE
jgi:hypothetical protein